MSNEEKKDVSAGQAGSTDNLIQAGPSDNGESAKAEPTVKSDNADVFKKQYEEAEKKLGEQGNELGEFRTFFNEVSPLMDKLQSQPELVEAIMDNKIDSTLVEAVLNNKVKIEDAAIITEAKKEVKADLGKKVYDKTSGTDIEKMINEKISEVSKGLKNEIKTSESRAKFEKRVDAFISNTPDFSEYVEDVNDWLNKHPEIYDIEVAYDAVKGKALAAGKIKDDEIAKAEEAKKIALNAGGGGSQGTQISRGDNMVDTLISGSSNPNSF